MSAPAPSQLGRAASSVMRSARTTVTSPVPCSELVVGVWNIMDFGGGYGPQPGCRWTPETRPAQWDQNTAKREENEKLAETLNKNNSYGKAHDSCIGDEFLTYALYRARVKDLAGHITRSPCDVVVLLELLTSQKGSKGLGVVKYNSESRPYLYLITCDIATAFEKNGFKGFDEVLLAAASAEQITLANFIQNSASKTRGSGLASSSNSGAQLSTGAHSVCIYQKLLALWGSIETEIAARQNGTPWDGNLWDWVVQRMYNKLLELLNIERTKDDKGKEPLSNTLTTSEDEPAQFPEIAGGMTGNANQERDAAYDSDGGEYTGDSKEDRDAAMKDHSDDENYSLHPVTKDEDKSFRQRGVFGARMAEDLAGNDAALALALDLIKRVERQARRNAQAAVQPFASSSFALVAPLTGVTATAPSTLPIEYSPPEKHDKYSYAILKDLNEFLAKQNWGRVAAADPMDDGETIGVTCPLNGRWTVEKISRLPQTFYLQERHPHFVELCSTDNSAVRIALLAAHAPAPDRVDTSLEWYKQLNKCADDLSSGVTAVILAADMNTEWAKTDSIRYLGWVPVPEVHKWEKTSLKKPENESAAEPLNPFDKVLLRHRGSWIGSTPLYSGPLENNQFSSQDGGRRYSDHLFVWRRFLIPNARATPMTTSIPKNTAWFDMKGDQADPGVHFAKLNPPPGTSISGGSQMDTSESAPVLRYGKA